MPLNFRGFCAPTPTEHSGSPSFFTTSSWLLTERSLNALRCAQDGLCSPDGRRYLAIAAIMVSAPPTSTIAPLKHN